MSRMNLHARKSLGLRHFDLPVGVWGAATLVALAGCGSSSSGDGSPDSQASDATQQQEAGVPAADATTAVDGSTDAGTGTSDSASVDAATADSGVADGGTLVDATVPDATVADGAADAGTIPDSGLDSGTDTGVGDTGTPRDATADAAAADSGVADAADGGAVSCASPLGGGPVTTTTTHLDIGVHDPSMTWDGTKYFLFATGGTLDIRSSANMQTWSNVGNIFTAVPAWITTALGANPGDLWAPDISYFNGQFHVYYAGSTFGTNTSVIGLATNTTLETSNKAYGWVDQGLVEQSKSTDNFNAIDPNVSFDQSCAPWLAFGSFWTGIKLHKLDPTTGKLATDDTTMYSIAERPSEGAIEAASIISHNGFFYLFVSFDLCCKGVDSTYRTMVGRSTGSITGPYVDQTGTAMLKGGGDQLLASSGRYIGPGGGTAWKDGDTYLYAYHYYDGDDNGNSKLQIRPIQFSATDWITLGDPLFP